MENKFQKKNEIDILTIINIILERKFILIGSLSLSLIISFIYIAITPKIYEADALLQVEERKSAMAGLEDVASLLDEKSSVGTEIELIRSRMVLGEVIDQLRLNIYIKKNPMPILGSGLSNLNIKTPSFLKDFSWTWAEDEINVEDLKVKPKMYDVEMQVVSQGANEYLLKIPDLGFEKKGKVGEVFFDEKKGIKLNIIELSERKGATFFLTYSNPYKSFKSLSNQILIEEKGKKTGILRLSITGSNINKIVSILDVTTKQYFLQNVRRMSAEAEKSLEFLRENIPEVETTVQTAQAKLSTFQEKNQSVDLNLETKSLLEKMVILQTKVSDSKIKENGLKKKYTEEHPIYNALKQDQNLLNDQIKLLTKELKKLPGSQQEFLTLKRDLQVNQEIYIALLNRIQELEIVKAGTVGNVRIIDNAEINPDHVKPRSKVIIIIGVLFGFIIGSSIIALITLLHTGIEGPSQLEEIGLNVYASVPFSSFQNDLEIRENRQNKRVLKEHVKGSILAKENPSDVSVEALRSFRTGLHFAMMESKNNSIMISGPSPGVGKSFISVNLATTCAFTGQKILLIDADLRKGYLHRYFTDLISEGLSELISKDLNFSDVIQSTSVNNLDFIERGQIPPNPSELLMTKKFQDLIKWANENYDLVIIDTPPILAVTDAAIVGSFTGTNFIITRFKKNTVKEVEVCVSRFSGTGIKIHGALLNGIERKSGGYGYNYSDGYGYYNYEYKSSESDT